MSGTPKYSEDAIRSGRRTDEALRAGVVPCREGDAYREGDRVTDDSGSAGTVLGRMQRTAHESRTNAPVRYMIELDRELPHGRRVIGLAETRMTPKAAPAPSTGGESGSGQ